MPLFVNADSRQERKDIMENKTQELKWNDHIFKIGQRVRTTDDCDFFGLEGVIIEIRTGEDKETDNPTPDIHCSFEYPDSEEMVKKLEEHFSSLYGSPQKLDAIALDEVIMAPDELTILSEAPTLILQYIGSDDWDRPVYQDQFERLWKDTELGDSATPLLHSVIGNTFDGEPDMLLRKSFKIQKAMPENPYRFQYMMLSRLQSDCEYYIHTCPDAVCLHQKDEKRQIAYMKELWNEFPDDAKPLWLTWEQILEYEKALCPDNE